jgi:serine phosphatase RsbU (regulator of sigma subunit)
MRSVEALAAASLFRGVSLDRLGALVSEGEQRRLADGDVLLRPGDHNRMLWVLLSGRLEIRFAGGAPGSIEVEAGDCVGEFSIIDGEPASAWVVARGACELLGLPEHSVWSSLFTLPAFVRNLLQILTQRLRRAVQRQAAYDQLLKELQVARVIQSSMLPVGHGMFPDHPELSCGAAMDAAAAVGGDFFDAFFLDERHLFLAVGDVAGKGIAAALFMARCLTLLRQEALQRRPVRELMGRVNQTLAQAGEAGPFLALFAAVLDATSGELRFANGGLGTPLLRRAGRWERPAMPRGLVLGIFPEFEYEAGRLRLAPGDALAVFTDGVTDAAGTEGEPFGEARLLEALEQAGDPPAPEVVSAVRERVRAFVGGADPVDDFTLLVVKRCAEPQ